MEFRDVVAARRMVRTFTDEPVPVGLIEELIDLARRAPSAGNTQGTEYMVLEGPSQTARYWDVTLPEGPRRSSFAWPGLLRAPALVLPLANRDAYLRRYREPDKAGAGLGDPERWAVPYWLVDAGMATQQLLLAVTAAGLGASLFGLFDHEEAVKAALEIPDHLQPVATIAIGHPAPDRPGRSAVRPRRRLVDLIHRPPPERK